MMLLLLGNKKKSNAQASAIVRKLFGEGVREEQVSIEGAQEMSGNQMRDATREVMTAINSDDIERCENALCQFFDIYSEQKELENEGMGEY